MGFIHICTHLEDYASLCIISMDLDTHHLEVYASLCIIARGLETHTHLEDNILHIPVIVSNTLGTRDWKHKQTNTSGRTHCGHEQILTRTTNDSCCYSVSSHCHGYHNTLRMWRWRAVSNTYFPNTYFPHEQILMEEHIVATTKS
jgi:hypothetical protein